MLQRKTPVIERQDSHPSSSWRGLLRALMVRADDPPGSMLQEVYRSQILGWRYYVIAIVAAIALVTALTFMSDRKFTGEMYVSSTSFSQGQEGGGLLGAASVVGLGQVGEFVSPFQIYLTLLRSRTAAQALHGNEELLKKLFAHRWNGAAGTWVADPSIFDQIFDMPYTAKPNVGEIEEYLKNSISIRLIEDDISLPVAIYRIGLQHPDPAVAVETLTLLHEHTDEAIRSWYKKNYQDQIDYAESQLELQGSRSLRDSLILLISNLQEDLAFAHANADFAAAMIEPPQAQEEPSSPRPQVAFAIAIALALFLAFNLALLLHARWRLE